MIVGITYHGDKNIKCPACGESKLILYFVTQNKNYIDLDFCLPQAKCHEHFDGHVHPLADIHLFMPDTWEMPNG